MSNHFEKIIPATQARKDFFTLLKGLQQPGRYYTITLEGKPAAVFLSPNLILGGKQLKWLVTKSWLLI